MSCICIELIVLEMHYVRAFRVFHCEKKSGELIGCVGWWLDGQEEEHNIADQHRDRAGSSVADMEQNQHRKCSDNYHPELSRSQAHAI